MYHTYTVCLGYVWLIWYAVGCDSFAVVSDCEQLYIKIKTISNFEATTQNKSNWIEIYKHRRLIYCMYIDYIYKMSCACTTCFEYTSSNSMSNTKHTWYMIQILSRILSCRLLISWSHVVYVIIGMNVYMVHIYHRMLIFLIFILHQCFM